MPKKSATICLIEELYEKPIKEVLREMYVDQKMPMRTIAKKLHISPGTVNNYLRKEGIASRQCHWI